MAAALRPARQCFTRWLAWTAVLNLAWEVLQLPLYTIYETGTPAWIAFAVLHCTAGDVLISLICYVGAALGAQSTRWPLERPRGGLAIALPLGVAYTAFSEWLNVSVRASWEYAAAMPTVHGLGLSPLLQWLLIPPIAVLLMRRTV